MTWLQEHWIAIVATVWSIDQALKLVAKLTPFKWDDNVADIIGGFLAKFFPKGQ